MIVALFVLMAVALVATIGLAAFVVVYVLRDNRRLVNAVLAKHGGEYRLIERDQRPTDPMSKEDRLSLDEARRRMFEDAPNLPGEVAALPDGM